MVAGSTIIAKTTEAETKAKKRPITQKSHADDHKLSTIAKESPAITAPGILINQTEDDVSNLPKTTGEKFYDILQFTVGKAAIMVFTAGIVYVAKYGKDKYGPVPNVFKKFQEWFHDKLLHNKIYPIAEKGEFANRVAGAAANTMVTFHGGNLFAPFMWWMENHHEYISNLVNKRWGKPGEVAIAHERLKDEPKQTWGDVLKGRLAAWALVFSGFTAIDAIIGKNKKLNMHYFDVYEEWFGRKMAGLSTAGKDIGKIPLGTALTPAQDANKLYRFSKALALDVYATSIAILLWNGVSRGLAKKRQEKNAKKPEIFAGMEAPALVAESMENAQAKPEEHQVLHSAKFATPAQCFTETVAEQKVLAEATPMGMGA